MSASNKQKIIRTFLDFLFGLCTLQSIKEKNELNKNWVVQLQYVGFKDILNFKLLNKIKKIMWCAFSINKVNYSTGKLETIQKYGVQ